MTELFSRDLLPIPLGEGLEDVLYGACAPRDSSGQRRKARSSIRAERWLREGLAALNDLGGLGMGVSRDLPLTSAQVSSVRHMAKY